MASFMGVAGLYVLMHADFVAGGTMLISRADLAMVGGWRPVPKSVDRALLDRVREWTLVNYIKVMQHPVAT